MPTTCNVTGVPHPGAEEVIAVQEPDWRKVAAWLTGPVPDGHAIWYQKHMAHHLLPKIDRRMARRTDSRIPDPRA